MLYHSKKGYEIAGYTKQENKNNMQNLTEQQSYQYCEDTKSLRDKLELGYIEVAKRLYNIKTNRLYEGQYGSWSLFLDDAKIGQSKAEQLVRIYEKFILEYKLPEQQVVEAGGWSVVVKLLPMAKTRDLAQNALLQASLLPNRVCVAEYVKQAVEDDFKTCSHNDTYTIKICRTCGERFKINDTDTEHN